ncbi:MAG: endolytic transglycosylase MltG [Candidatus Riflebacteria bacterium]|nr:endolytic transglycosylase MltG [Candidatus Riflebacteria bacterium]
MLFVKYFLFGVVLSALAIMSFVAGGALWFNEMLASRAAFSAPVEVTIPKGLQTRQIAGVLKGSRVVSSAFVFSFWVRFNGVSNRLRPGTYKFNGGESIDDIISILLEGREENFKFTIPEGLTLKMIAQALESSQACSAESFLEKINSRELVSKVFSDWGTIPNPEGLAFPETYIFRKGVTASEIAETMLLMTKNVVEKACSSSNEKDLSVYQKCILASIVERECKLESERPLVASVFLNRLKKNMRLESCATVQYALPMHKERLLYEDLRIVSPYNTYQNIGLPPTPISNFGRSSIEAVASPAQSEFLFFVSDASEGHRFAKSAAEHDRNKKIFFEERKKNKLSTDEQH